MPDGMNFDPRLADEIKREITRIGDDVKGLNESMRRDLEEARKTAEAASKAADQTETKARLEALSASVVEKNAALEEQIKAMVQRADAIDVALQRAPQQTSDADAKAQAEAKTDAIEFFKSVGALNPGRFSAIDIAEGRFDVEASTAWQKSFGNALRFGVGRAVDAKALSVGVDTDGGFIVPVSTSRQIISKFYETSPIRQIAMIETIGTDELEIPVDDDEVDAGWVGETTTRTETGTPKLGMKKIQTHEQYAEPHATQKLLDDASINIEAWLAAKVADKFSRKEATAFVVGTGVSQPRGFLTYPAGTNRGQIEQVVSGNATEVTSDGLRNLTMAIKSVYLGGATFLMKRSTEAKVITLKNGQGDYMWRPAQAPGMLTSIDGFPVRQADDMPVVGAGALPIAFGNFRQGYTIVDRMGIRTMRDPFTSKPFVKFYTTRRVGGDVTTFEAIKLMVISA